MPSETKDGSVSVPIGITCDGVTLDRYSFTVVLPALNKSPEAAKLSADMELMKTALKNLPVTANTTGDEVLAAVNAAAVNGTKAVWDDYKYYAPTSTVQGSIDGNMIFALGGSKDVFRAHKVLPIAGTASDAAIDADFSALSKALHNHAVSNRTTQQELMDIAAKSIKNGSKLRFAGFTKNEATYEKEGKIVISFEMELDGKTRSPRIEMRMSKLRSQLPTGISITQDEWEVLRLTNIERYKNKCAPLIIVTYLQDAADIRVEEIKIDYRKDHKRPDGSSYFTAIDPAFRKNRKLGENANMGVGKHYEAVESWMNSSGHRANILTPEFCYLGIGVSGSSEYKYWVQMFSDGSGIIQAETSTGTYHFNTIADMEEVYLICTTGEGFKGYVPLDADYMVRNGNQYAIHFKGKSVTVTVGDN